MGRLFGTDGVRGKAGEFPLDPPTVRRIGAAVARALAGDGAVRILSGRDTRESGPWIERELAAGIRSEGGVLVSAGVIPTPAVAYVTPLMGFTAGIVISASHNSFGDNGIKVFSGKGEKFTEVSEAHVESIISDRSWGAGLEGTEVPSVELIDCRPQYLSHLLGILPDEKRTGARIAIDCANGATTSVAPQIFERLGFEVTCLACSPDGRNINLACGSTAPQMLARAVVDGGYRLGIAYDGDGDRAIFVDAAGRIVDGDAVMLMCARQMKAEGRLKGDAVVATVMSNIGLEIALKQSGIEMIRCPVGDKFVMEELLRRELSLGGEQSGHVIFADDLFTGDGLATSLHVLRTIQATGRELGDLASDLQRRPQVLVNVRVDRRVDLRTIPAVAAVLSEVESKLDGTGRVLVRYSGTEPLLRVMIEGPDEVAIGRFAEEIVNAVKHHLGTGGGSD